MLSRLRSFATALSAPLRRAARRFPRDRRGNVTMLFGLSIVPVLGLTGAAVDYSRAAAIRTRLDSIADTAALNAVSHTAVGALPNTPDNGKAATETFFKSQASLLQASQDFTLGTVSATITRNITTLSASVSYSATVPDYFGSLIGMNTQTVSGTSTSSTYLPVYIDFYLILDNSPSMGLGATTSDINTMVKNTSDKCAFACHESDLPNKDYYALARKLGVTLRIDMVRQAVKSLTDTATATRSFSSQYRMAVYTFNNSVTQVASLTTDLSSVKAAADKIDLTTVAYQGDNNDRFTDYDGMIPLTAMLPMGGNGYTAATPQALAFIVTDGVADEPTPGNSNGRTIKPIPLALCTALKARGFQIAALYTTYFPLPTNSFYMQNVAPWVDTIGPTMQSCATAGLYFEVSPDQGISDAMNALFRKYVSQARLTG